MEDLTRIRKKVEKIIEHPFVLDHIKFRGELRQIEKTYKNYRVPEKAAMESILQIFGKYQREMSRELTISLFATTPYGMHVRYARAKLEPAYNIASALSFEKAFDEIRKSQKNAVKALLSNVIMLGSGIGAVTMLLLNKEEAARMLQGTQALTGLTAAGFLIKSIRNRQRAKKIVYNTHRTLVEHIHPALEEEDRETLIKNAYVLSKSSNILLQAAGRAILHGIISKEKRIKKS